MARYTRIDGQGGTVEAACLDGSDTALDLLGPGDHTYDPDAGVLSIMTRHGVVIPVPAGEFVLRDEAGHVSHMPADAFTEAFKPAATDEPDEPAPAVPGPDTITPGEVAVGIVDESGTEGTGM